MTDHTDFHEAGIRVFGLNGSQDGKTCDCGNPECKALFKHPKASNWQHTPDWSDEQMEVMEEYGYFETGYGVLLHGLLVIDVDERNGGVDAYETLCELIPEVQGSGLIVKTGSGGQSKHLYFSIDPSIPICTHHNSFKGIDFKSGNGFTVGPGSIHASGNLYETLVGEPCDIAPAPQALIELLRKPERHRAIIDGTAIDVADSDLRDMCAFIDPSCDHETWIRVGMALHHATQGSGLSLWDDWSAGGDSYPGYDQLDKRWQSFGKSSNPVSLGTLMHYAREGGYVEPVDFVPTVTFDMPETPVDDVTIDLLRPPGFVGELCAWINGQSLYPRESLAVAAALTAISNMAGMRYRDELDGMTPNIIAFCVAGSGCHAKGHEILMHNGEVKKVEEIQVGENLMGWDSKPRTVKALARGREKMALITPIKGESFIVNINHILHLRKTGRSETKNITVSDWLSSNSKFKSKWKLARFGVDYSEKNLLVNPYVIGALLGDGTLVKGKIQITSMDEEIHREVADDLLSNFNGLKARVAQNAGTNKSWHTAFTYGRKGNLFHASGTPLNNHFDNLGLLGKTSSDKFIPFEYLTGSRNQRLELLAGLIDTDGSLTCGGYDYISKSEKLAEGIKTLSRSLGLAAYISECEKYSQNKTGGTYYRVSISGDCSLVPVRLAHKKAEPRKQIKNVLNTGFSVDMLPENDFYGFNISGDHVYLDAGFTAHHNTGKEAIGKAFAEVMRLADLSPALYGAFKSEQELYRNLLRHQPAYYSIDELGIQLTKIKNAMSRGGASYLEGLLGAVMSVYSKADSFVPVTGDLKEEIRAQLGKEYAAINKQLDDGRGNSDLLERKLKTVERQLSTIDQGIDSPYLSIIGYTTPATFDGLFDFEQATNGFLSRAMIFKELENNPKRKPSFKKMPMTEQMQNTLFTLRHGGSYSVVQDARIEHTAQKVGVPTTPEAAELLDKAYNEFWTIAEQHKNQTGLEAIPRRGYEMAAKVSLILALPGGLRTEEHVRWAVALAKRDINAKLLLAQSNSAESDTDRMAAKIISHLDKDHQETIGVLKNKVRGFDIAVLDKLVSVGVVIKTDTGKTRNGEQVFKYSLS